MGPTCQTLDELAADGQFLSEYPNVGRILRRAQLREQREHGLQPQTDDVASQSVPGPVQPAVRIAEAVAQPSWQDLDTSWAGEQPCVAVAEHDALTLEDVVDKMRGEEVELAANLAIERELLLRRNRELRTSSMKAAMSLTAAERADTCSIDGDRLRRAQAALRQQRATAEAPTKAVGNDALLARCLEASHGASDAEKARLRTVWSSIRESGALLLRQATKEGTDTEVERISNNIAEAQAVLERGLWAMQHAYEATLRCVADTRTDLEDLGHPNLAGSGNPVENGAQACGGAAKEHCHGAPALIKHSTPAVSARRDAWALEYQQALAAAPYASAQVWTAHGPSWVRWRVPEEETMSGLEQQVEDLETNQLQHAGSQRRGKLAALLNRKDTS